MGWRKRRQRKRKKEKEKGGWTKKVVSRKQRGTQERKYEGEGTSKKDNEDGKREGIILERNGFTKKKEVWDFIRQFEIVELGETWVEKRSWEKIEKLLQMGMSRGKTRKEEMKSGGAEFWKFLELIF
jgi:hypothetical protein